MGREQASLVIADALLSCCLFAPLTIASWRGIWRLVEHYIYPERPALSSWISVFIGTVFHLVFYFCQEVLRKNVTTKNKCQYVLLSKLYTLVFAFVCVNHWRGIWSALDVYTGMNIPSAAASVSVGIVGLSVLRTLKNLMASPLTVVIDYPKDYFTYPTMFRTEKRSSAMYIADCFFSVCIIGTFVVFGWRGAWELLDFLLYPHNPVRSAWGSLGLGFISVTISVALQFPLYIMTGKLREGLLRLILLDIHYALGFFGVINFWRGYWNLQDIYLFPENFLLSNWLSTVVGVFGSMCFMSAHTILVRGVYLDDEEPGGQAAFFGYAYLRYFLDKKKEETKKRVDTSKEAGSDINPAAVVLLDGVKVTTSINNVPHDDKVTDATETIF